jgi:hypothetical protein
MISKRGSNSTMVAASLARMLISPSNLRGAVLDLLPRSAFAPIIEFEVAAVDGERQVGLLGLEPWMLVSVAFSSSMRNFSPLSGVMRFMVKRRPSALRLSMRMPRKLRNNSVDMARITSGLLELADLALRDAGAQLVGGGEEAVAQAGVFLLVAELLEDVGEQVLGPGCAARPAPAC